MIYTHVYHTYMCTPTLAYLSLWGGRQHFNIICEWRMQPGGRRNADFAAPIVNDDREAR